MSKWDSFRAPVAVVPSEPALGNRLVNYVRESSHYWFNSPGGTATKEEILEADALGSTEHEHDVVFTQGTAQAFGNHSMTRAVEVGMDVASLIVQESRTIPANKVDMSQYPETTDETKLISSHGISELFVTLASKPESCVVGRASANQPRAFRPGIPGQPAVLPDFAREYIRSAWTTKQACAAWTANGWAVRPMGAVYHRAHSVFPEWTGKYLKNGQLVEFDGQSRVAKERKFLLYDTNIGLFRPPRAPSHPAGGPDVVVVGATTPVPEGNMEQCWINAAISPEEAEVYLKAQPSRYISFLVFQTEGTDTYWDRVLAPREALPGTSTVTSVATTTVAAGLAWGLAGGGIWATMGTAAGFAAVEAVRRLSSKAIKHPVRAASVPLAGVAALGALGYGNWIGSAALASMAGVANASKLGPPQIPALRPLVMNAFPKNFAVTRSPLGIVYCGEPKIVRFNLHFRPGDGPFSALFVWQTQVGAELADGKNLEDTDIQNIRADALRQLGSAELICPRVINEAVRGAMSNYKPVFILTLQYAINHGYELL